MRHGYKSLSKSGDRTSALPALSRDFVSNNTPDLNPGLLYPTVWPLFCWAIFRELRLWYRVSTPDLPSSLLLTPAPTSEDSTPSCLLSKTLGSFLPRHSRHQLLSWPVPTPPMVSSPDQMLAMLQCLCIMCPSSEQQTSFPPDSGHNLGLYR